MNTLIINLLALAYLYWVTPFAWRALKMILRESSTPSPDSLKFPGGVVLVAISVPMSIFAAGTLISLVYPVPMGALAMLAAIYYVAIVVAVSLSIGDEDDDNWGGGDDGDDGGDPWDDFDNVRSQWERKPSSC